MIVKFEETELRSTGCLDELDGVQFSLYIYCTFLLFPSFSIHS
jgi:hypothetical protein